MPETEFLSGMDFGSGVDSRGKVRGCAVGGGAPAAVAAGQITEITLSLLESQEDFDKYLGISASVSASYCFIGGSANFNFGEQCSFHSYSVYVLAHAKVSNPLLQIKSPELQKGGDLLSTGDVDRFREEFGDLFVMGIRTGGELSIVLEIEKFSKTNNNDIKADLTAGGGIFGPLSASTTDSVTSVMKSASQGHNITVHHSQGGGDQEASTDIAACINQALGFSKTVTPQTGVPVSVFLQDYRSLDLPKPPNFIEVENAREVLETIMSTRRDALTRLNNINFILTHPEQFINPGNLNLSAQKLATAIKVLTDAASQCVDNPKGASIPTVEIPTDPLPLPVDSKMNLIAVPNVCGQTQAAAQSRIESVGLTVGQVVAPANNTGVVVSQSPTPADGPVQRGRSVILTLAERGTLKVPTHIMR